MQKNKKLDFIDNIEIDSDKLLIDNLHALNYSTNGILYLANITKHEEDKFRDGMYGKANFHIGSSINQFIPNLFNWFSISIVSYCRLIQLLDLMGKNNWSVAEINIHKDVIKRECIAYVKKVIPEVYEWRNKIAAHFAITDPEGDNRGTLEISVFGQVSWFESHFQVGVFNLSIENEKSDIPSWSIIKILEDKLIPRYWPGIKFDK